MKCVCGSTRLERVRRTWWQRLLPWSRRYLCSGCARTVLRLLPR